MIRKMFSLRNRLAFGNVTIGLCLISLGIARIVIPDRLFTFGAAVYLLLVSVLALVASLSPLREMPDEMSAMHDGQAAAHTLRFFLAVMGLLCALSMSANIELDFAGVGLGLIGFGLLVYGVVFGWLER
ncbi:MAG: hypothetical protein IKG21_11255 [Atopobiaceae bacterium]|nr:hypothetical protein [Atopobiaceae bacterium]